MSLSAVFFLRVSVQKEIATFHDQIVPIASMLSPRYGSQWMCTSPFVCTWQFNLHPYLSTKVIFNLLIRYLYLFIYLQVII